MLFTLVQLKRLPEAFCTDQEVRVYVAEAVLETSEHQMTDWLSGYLSSLLLSYGILLWKACREFYT